ncbi:MAG: SIS domain-containing protein [Candidatus Brocadiia bacterium]|jgi:glucosamine--fructose-6-phosphate aminotransferase (isomerizing)|nr:SIS domain-containing protein [Candidatus Brocadiia bacterium]
MKQELFLKEVLDQQRVLSRVLKYYLAGDGRTVLARAARLCARAGRGPVFTGMGSSCYAPIISAHILNSHALPAAVWEAGELLYYHLDGLGPDNVLVAVSQSGRTIELRKIVSAVEGKMPIIGITNNTRSWLAQHSDVVLPLLAGVERMSSSKTYMNTIAVLSMLAWRSLGALASDRKQQLLAVPALLGGVLHDAEERAGQALRFLGRPRFLHLVARGPSLSTAMQAQVILKEGAHILTEAQSGASFRHGPFEVISRGHRAMVFVPEGRTAKIMLDLVRDMAAQGSKVLLVTNAPAAETTGNIHVYPLPAVPEHVFPMLDIVPVEFLLLLLARRKGMEPGAITKGNKVTVRE